MDTSTSTQTLSTQTRRRFALALGGGLLLLSRDAAGAAVESQKRRKKPKFRTVTKTFTNSSPIAILDSAGPADLYPAPIQVSGFKRGKLLDVNVTLKQFSRGFPDDVDVLLVAPNGRQAVIMSEVGGIIDVFNVTVTLDDQADAPLPNDTQLGSGRFKPTDFDIFSGDTFPPPAPAGSTNNVKLATFTGINPNGIWKLFVSTNVLTLPGGFGGGWSLTIKARVRK